MAVYYVLVLSGASVIALLAGCRLDPAGWRCLHRRQAREADAMTHNLTVRCRAGIYRLSIIDRRRVVLTGRVFVSVVNGKAHTQVYLTSRRPIDK